LALEIGVFTLDEIRALEDRPPMSLATLDDMDPALPEMPVIR
jgi:hypothetical protein